MDNPKIEYLYKICVVGDRETGKTSFVKKIVYDVFSSTYKETIGADFNLSVKEIDGEIFRLQLWDIGGQERFGTMTKKYYEETTAVFLIVDAMKESTITGAIKWKNDLDNKLGKPVILLVNKTDLIYKIDLFKKNVIMDYDAFCNTHGFHSWINISAKTGIGIESAYQMMINICKTSSNLIDMRSAIKIPIENPNTEIKIIPKIVSREKIYIRPKKKLDIIPESNPIPELEILPIAELEIDPIAELAIDPILQLAIDPIPELAIDPILQLAIDPILQLAIDPIPELEIDPIAELEIDPIAELEIDPIAELAIDPILQLAIDPILQLTIDPILQLEIDPISELKIELGINTNSDTYSDSISDTYSDSIFDTYSDTYSDSISDTYSDSIFDTYSDTYSDSISDPKIRYEPDLNLIKRTVILDCYFIQDILKTISNAKNYTEAIISLKLLFLTLYSKTQEINLLHTNQKLSNILTMIHNLLVNCSITDTIKINKLLNIIMDASK